MLHRSIRGISGVRSARLLALVLAVGLSSCRGGSDSTVIVAPVPPVTDAVFPLGIAPTKRFLTDATGTPFLIVGDAAWGLMARLKREEVDAYLDDRHARGFNTLLVRVLEHYYTDSPPRNAYGDAPFLTPGDFSTPNERYFAHVDWVLQRARSKGFLVLVVPAYLGYQGGKEGWYSEMVANGPARLLEYGRYLGRRYSGYGNILWVHGGDFNTPDRSIINAIVAGIREFDSTALHSAHCGQETAAIVCACGEPWLTINSIYTRGSVHAQSLAAYTRAETMPFFLIEGRYENEYDGTEQRVRAQVYQTRLSGAMGNVFGNNPIWHFDSPTGPGPVSVPSGKALSTTWRKALGSRGAQSMTHVRALFAPRSWWTMEPDTANSALTEGLGLGTDRAVAARAADRSFAIVYMPSLRTVTFDLAQLAGPKVSARWYDPASGSYTTVDGSPFSASGSRTFRPAGNNSSSSGDWALVLESSQ